MCCRHVSIKCHIPSFSGSLDTAVKLEAKWKFLTTAVLFYDIQKNYFNRSCNDFLKISYDT